MKLSRLRLALCLVSLLVSGCGSSPTAPSASAPPAPTPAPTPQPTPPPAPTFPSMLGAWAGTLTINASIGGLSASNVCTESWIITSQTAGDFGGTFQLSGGTTAACAQSGTMFGNISSTGAVNNIGVNVTVGVAQGCTRTSSDPYAGIASSSSLNAQASERLTCTIGGVTNSGSRSLVMSLTKR